MSAHARVRVHSCARAYAHMQLSHSAKELQMHQKNMGTQYAALKHEFDQSVRAAGAKTRELEKADKELQKNASDHTKHLAKLTTQMQVRVGPCAVRNGTVVWSPLAALCNVHMQ
jgi:hypothetical protein